MAGEISAQVICEVKMDLQVILISEHKFCFDWNNEIEFLHCKEINNNNNNIIKLL